MIKVRTILFDIDGTLIDSNHAHAGAWAKALGEAGFEIPIEKVLPLIGMGGDKLLPSLTKLDIESAKGKAIDQRRGEVFRKEYLPKLKAFPKARALVEGLKARGFKTVVATSASKKDLNGLLKQTDLANLFDEAATSSEAESSKPDPDILQAALAKVAETPAFAVMIGDTPYDHEAAKKAGVRSIGVLCGGWKAEDLRTAGAAECFEGPEAMFEALKQNRVQSL